MYGRLFLPRCSYFSIQNIESFFNNLNKGLKGLSKSLSFLLKTKPGLVDIVFSKWHQLVHTPWIQALSTWIRLRTQLRSYHASLNTSSEQLHFITKYKVWMKWTKLLAVIFLYNMYYCDWKIIHKYFNLSISMCDCNV